MIKRLLLHFGWAVLLAGFLFGSSVYSAGDLGWLRTVGMEIQAACRDAGTQWMVVICLLSYLIVFVVLEAKSRVLGLGSKVGEQETGRPTSNAQSAKPNDSGRESKVEGREREGLSLSSNFHPPSSSRPRAISSPDFWLIGFVALVLLRYALDYTNAAKSLQVVVLLTGMVVGKGIALWAGAARRFKFQVSSVKPTAGREAKVEGREPGEKAVRHLTPALSPVEAERVVERPTCNAQQPTSKEVGQGSHPPAAGGASVRASRLVSSLAPPEESGAYGVTRPTMILGIIVFLLACAALWHPERGMEFQYRGQPRWTGPWDNPNLFGVVMGVGTVLAVGLLVQSLRSKVQGREAEAEGCEPGQVGRGSPLPAVGGASVRASRLVRSLAPTEEAGAHGVTRPTINSACWSRAGRFLLSLFLLSALVLCAFGLLKSYSRGAWLGTACGLAFLIWKWFNREPREIREKEIQRDAPIATFGHPLPVGRGERGGAHGVTRPTSQLSRIWRISRWNGNWFPISVFLLSAFVLCFWQFRHTEAPLARRVFSVGNPNDFSWRNRVAAWEGAGRMMLARPIIGFGWGKAEEVYSKEYRAARLEESAAIQMNDYLMIGISAGTPALACLLGYLLLTGFQISGFKFQARQAETLDLGLKPLDSMPTICFAGAIVGMVGFWFDGGLFKLPTGVVFWVLVELARGSRRGDEAVAALASDEQNGRAALLRRPAEQQLGPTELQGASVRASRLVSSLAPPSGDTSSGCATFSPIEAERGASCTGDCGAQRTARPTIALRWLAGIAALGALGLTTLHLGTPQFAVSERTLSIARKFLVSPGEKADFEFLAAKNIWSNMPLKLLLQHAHLANYNRTLVNWKLDEPMYREFVLSPEIILQPETSNLKPSDDFSWRRPLWEYFYPRIRKESSLEAAAEIVVRQLNNVCRRRGDETNHPLTRPPATLSPSDGARGTTPEVVAYTSVLEIWQQREASDAEFARVCVAAWRAVGIPARLVTSGQAEFWNGTEWKPAARPVEASPTDR